MASLSVVQRLAYASGQAGNVLGYQLVATFLLPLYLPPLVSGATSRMPGLAWGVGTFFLINVLARGIDTFFDPFIANRSDRSRHPFGRRRAFMIAGAAPLALCTGLMFFPPIAGESPANAGFLALTLTAYFCFYSTYVAPYLALLPELAPDKDESTDIATLQAGAALFGGMIASVVAPMFLPAVDPDRRGLQTMAAVLAAISFVMLVIPILGIDETRLIRRAQGEAASHAGLLASLKQTAKDRAFVRYVLGNNFFFVGFTIVQTAAPAYVEVLLGRPLADLGLVIGPLFGAAGLAFFAVPPLQRRVGKRRLMIGGSVMLALLIGAGVPLIAWQPAFAIPIFALSGVPIALFLAVPNAMLADICAANARRTGEQREGMFFGAQGFLQKISLGLAVGAVSWLSEAFGKSTTEPLGVILTGPLCALALLAGTYFFWRYPEAEVQREMEKSGGGGN